MKFLGLKAFGCSHTEGAELKDPESSAWPIILGNQLELSCENRGTGGASNEHIIYEAAETAKANIGTYLIVILTTACSRVYWPSIEKKSYVNISKPEVTKDTGIHAYKEYIKYHYDFNIVLRYQNFLFRNLKELLESRGHIVYIFS